MKNVGGAYMVMLVLLFAAAVAQGLCLVWVNIERVDYAYEIKRLQTQVDAQAGHIAKLQVERDNLINPRRLDQLAKEYGLGPAKPGQIRRFTEDGKEVAVLTLPGQVPAEKPEKKDRPVKDSEAKKAEAKAKKKKTAGKTNPAQNT